ncbi:MAG: peptidylprolyl isomerase [Candidatus Krumholzibacteria bacterium]|nr:peptidylprolyl isomerase [Candidatus Krumholzibacteria bacterium]
MAKAKPGDTVVVHYTGRLEDGTQFDTSIGQEPLRLQIGGGRFLPGFEHALAGMNPGESKTVSIPPADGYGERRDDMIVTVARDEIFSDVAPEVGERLEMTHEDATFVVTVTGITDETVTLDGNHPLAGQTLVFDLELVEIA